MTAHEQRDVVLAEVREMGPLEVREIARGTGIPVGAVRRALRSLKDEGLVESDRYMRKAPIWMETDEAEQRELRKAAYDALCSMGDAVTVGLDDLDLRAAAQHAQVVGDSATERRADSLLASRGVGR